MTEELQNLLDRIQKDGVDKAESQAAEIISAAKRKAEEIKSQAEIQAKANIERAERDAAEFKLRAEKAIQQSARDIILSIGEALQLTMKDIVRGELSGLITQQALIQMLTKVVESYFGQGSNTQQIELVLNPDEQKAVTDFFMSKYASALKSGLSIKGDNNIIRGFKVLVKDKNVEHNFSDEAIVEALCKLLRPYLADIIKKRADINTGKK